VADLMTHLATGLVCKGATRGRYTSVLLAGTVLPDVGARVPALLFSALGKAGIETPHELTFAFEILHMPIGILLVCYALSLCFVASLRRPVFTNLLAGATLHLLLDLAQGHLGVGYLLAYPFSTVDFEFGWIGTEATVKIAPVVFSLSLLFWWFRRGSQPHLEEPPEHHLGTEQKPLE
jgi:hypothetical protein